MSILSYRESKNNFIALEALENPEEVEDTYRGTVQVTTAGAEKIAVRTKVEVEVILAGRKFSNVGFLVAPRVDTFVLLPTTKPRFFDGSNISVSTTSTFTTSREVRMLWQTPSPDLLSMVDKFV